MRLDWHRFSVPLGVTDKQGRTHAPVVQLNLPHVDWERYDARAASAGGESGESAGESGAAGGGGGGGRAVVRHWSWRQHLGLARAVSDVVQPPIIRDVPGVPERRVWTEACRRPPTTRAGLRRVL